MESYVWKISTFLIASILFRVSQGSSNGKHLPTLLREKRLDPLDEERSDINEPIDVKSLGYGENVETLLGKRYRSKANNKGTTIGENIDQHLANNQDNESVERGKRKDSDDASDYSGAEIFVPELKPLEKHSQANTKQIHGENKIYLRQNPGKHNKMISPGIKFSVVSEKTRKISASPNSALQHQFRLNLKRKIRRRLKASKMKTRMERKVFEHTTKGEDIFAETSSEQEASVDSSASQVRKEEPKENSSSPRTSRLPKNFSKVLKTQSETPSLSSLPRIKIQNLPTTRDNIQIKNKKPSVYGPKPSLRRQKRRSPSKDSSDDLLDSSLKLSSTLRFTFKSPLDQTASKPPASLQPTKSTADSPTVLPLAAPAIAPSPSSVPDFQPSLKEIPSEDLMMLNDFFNNAADFKAKQMKAKNIPTKRQTHGIESQENHEEEVKENQSRPWKNIHDEQIKENTRNEKFVDNKVEHIGQNKETEKKQLGSSNEYAKKLLEFQRKAIQAEERRIDDEIKATQPQHEDSHRWRKPLHELDHENKEKQHHIHELFEELATKWKHRKNLEAKARTNLQGKQIESKGESDKARKGQGNQVHDLFEALSRKYKHKNLATQDNHKSRFMKADSNKDNDDELGNVNRGEKEIRIHRRKMLQQGNRPGRPTRWTHAKDNDDEIVEMAFTPTTRRFSPRPGIKGNSNDSGHGMEVSVSESGKIFVNNTTPTKSSTKDGNNNSYLKVNGTVHAPSGEGLSHMDKNNAKHSNRNSRKGEHTIFDNDDDDDDDDSEVVETVVAQDDDAPSRDGSQVKNNPALGGSHKKEVNDNSINYNLTGINDDNNFKDDIEDDDKQSHKNSDNNNDYNDNSRNSFINNNSDNKGKTTGINNNTNNNSISSNRNYSNKTSSNSDYNNNDDKNGSIGNIKNNTNEEEVPHDDRLLYILGDPEQAAKKQKNRKKIENLVDKVKLNDDQGIFPKVILNKDLRAKLKAMEIRVLDAHQKVSKDLEEIERHLTNKYESLQSSINQAKTLTKGMDDKINDTVLHVLKFAKTSADKAKLKIGLVQKAASALTDLEKRIGANETRNVAKVIKSKIAELPVNKYRSYQTILTVNNLITKMDGAKIIAESKANRSFSSKDEIEKNMADIATNVLEELSSTENELNTDTKVEMEDEREAEKKLEDAERRNFMVALKSGEALKKIERYLEQLEKEENKLRQTKT